MLIPFRFDTQKKNNLCLKIFYSFLSHFRWQHFIYNVAIKFILFLFILLIYAVSVPEYEILILILLSLLNSSSSTS
jgi:hypothetical protein